MIKGQDWSAYQPERPSTAGIDFAIIKATEGRSYTNPRMDEQTDHARRAGLVVGFYHFLWPGNINAQAAYFVQRAASKPGDILACDWEHTQSGAAATSAEKDAFMREVKRLRPDHRVLLYCNRDFWVNRDRSSYAADGLWIAQYNGRPGEPDIQARWLIHQYTSTPLDINVADFPTRAAMRSWAGGQQEDDMAVSDADAKKIAELAAERVWTKDNLAPLRTPVEGAENTHWAGGTFQRNTYLVVKRVETQLAAQSAVITEMAKTMAQLGQITDPDALVARIEQAIENVTIHLDVPDA